MNGEELRAARKRQGLTQAEVAEAAGIKQGYLSSIEIGEAVPTIDTLTRIAHALGLQVTISFTEAPAQEEPAPVAG